MRVTADLLEPLWSHEGDEQVQHHDAGANRQNHVLHGSHLSECPDGAREQREQQCADEDDDDVAVHDRTSSDQFVTSRYIKPAKNNRPMMTESISLLPQVPS
jgi:hypothetical protein